MIRNRFRFRTALPNNPDGGRHSIVRHFQELPFIDRFRPVFAAKYIPGLSGVLRVSPVNLSQWAVMLGLALSVLVVMEFYKWLRDRMMKQFQVAKNTMTVNL